MKSKPISILVVDDHRIVRQGIQSYFVNDEEINFVADTSNPYEALNILQEKDVDIVLLDINMPIMNGVDLCRKIKESTPDVKVIAISINDDYIHISEMFKAGASAYMLKDASPEHLKESMLAVTRNETYYDPKISKIVLQHLHKKNSSLFNQKLSIREQEVLRLLLQEKSNQEIADELGISISTLSTHKANLLLKTGSTNTVGLVKYALLNNLLDSFQ